VISGAMQPSVDAMSRASRPCCVQQTHESAVRTHLSDSVESGAYYIHNLNLCARLLQYSST
jgi:hypothetical protein